MSKAGGDHPGLQEVFHRAEMPLPVLQTPAAVTLPPMASVLSEVPAVRCVPPSFGYLPYHHQNHHQNQQQQQQHQSAGRVEPTPSVTTPVLPQPASAETFANSPHVLSQRDGRQAQGQEHLSRPRSPDQRGQDQQGPSAGLRSRLPSHSEPQLSTSQYPAAGPPASYPGSPEIPRTPPPASADVVSPTEEGDPTNTNIYTAVYSGVPVYEMVSRGIAVMRRRADSFLNATQILKVAGIEKGKRTKILERQIITGEHEKVQGGYGKYQGTWIPFERGTALAKQYGVERYLRPLFSYQQAAGGTLAKSTPTKEQAVAAMRKEAFAKGIVTATKKKPKPESGVRVCGPPSAPLTPFPSSAPSPSTASASLPAPLLPPRSAAPYAAVVPVQVVPNADRHRAALTAAFLTGGEDELPDILSSGVTLVDLDVNIAIDDQGHTALHWASALARMNILRRLVALGADVSRPNYMGETPLMRAVLVTNNLDRGGFRELLDLLGSSVPIADAKGRTVFHHIALTAGVPGCTAAAKYYMDCLVRWMSKRPGRFPTLVDAQDRNGDTALYIAARVGSQPVADLLLGLGADRNIASRVGLCPADFGVDDLEAAAGTEAACEGPWTDRPAVVRMEDTTASGADGKIQQTTNTCLGPQPLTPRTSPQQDARQRPKTEHAIDSRRRLELAEAVRQAVLEIDAQRDSDLIQIHDAVRVTKSEMGRLARIIADISGLAAAVAFESGGASNAVTSFYASPHAMQFRNGQPDGRSKALPDRCGARPPHQLSLLSPAHGGLADGMPSPSSATPTASKHGVPVSQLTWDLRDLCAEISAQVREADSALFRLCQIRNRPTAAAAGAAGAAEGSRKRSRSTSSPSTSPTAAPATEEESRLQNLRRLISAFCGVPVARVDELAESLLSSMDMATAREKMSRLRAALKSAEQQQQQQQEQQQAGAQLPPNVGGQMSAAVGGTQCRCSTSSKVDVMRDAASRDMQMS